MMPSLLRRVMQALSHGRQVQPPFPEPFLTAHLLVIKAQTYVETEATVLWLSMRLWCIIVLTNFNFSTALGNH